jgi:S1-C subfamily serine protease
MASPFVGYEVSASLRPAPRSVAFDLDATLSAVVALEARIPADAFTAATLGAERLGNGVVIGPEGLVLTIGYLVTEAEAVWLTVNDGRRVAAHVLGVDAATGFGLVHALEPLGVPALPLGDSRRLAPGAALISAGGGGRAHASVGRLLAREPFAGYWEYAIDEALFVEPAHPHWSGAALIGPAGELVGVGSLQMERRTSAGLTSPLNMFVPAELLAPILDDLASGRPASPPRPWLGVLSQEASDHVVIVDVTPGGPASRAELRRGDIVRKVGDATVSDLAGFYHRVWAQGAPGVRVPLTIQRERDVFEVEVRSADRTAMMRKPRLH